MTITDSLNSLERDNDTSSFGCPSGLSPAVESEADNLIDPTPFVRVRNKEDVLELVVFGAKCAGCIAKIEKGIGAIDGISSARLNLSTGRLTVSWPEGRVDPKAIVRVVKSLGYRAAPFDPSASETEHDEEGRRLLRALAVAGFAMANVMLLSISVWSGYGEMGEGMRSLMHLISALIAIPAALYAAQPFFRSAASVLRHGKANMDVPISLAVILALCLSTYEFFAGGEALYFDAAVMLLFFLLIGRYLDHRLRWRARAAARDLLALQSTTALRRNLDGTVTSIASRDIVGGDTLVLSPGDRFPVDCVVIEGDSLVDTSLVTGESVPVRLKAGGNAHAGVLNETERLIVKATATTDDSLISELSRLIEAGEQNKSRYMRLADRAASLYVPVVHSLAAATFLGWLLIADAGIRVSVMNAIAVLIITCPCALGLAAPAVQVVATGRLFQSGILVKSGDALERLAETTHFVFDKTGTLTFGRPTLRAASVQSSTLNRVAKLARISRHPLSRAIVDAVGPGEAADDAIEHPGFGIEGTVETGVSAKLGSAKWVGMNDGGGESPNDVVLETWYAEEGRQPVRLAFTDLPRRDAASVVAELKDRGLGVELLSGDRPDMVNAIASSIPFDKAAGGVSPTDKKAYIDSITDDGGRVAMIGDGLNDAPSLANAHVSLSPGSAADAAQAAADIVYSGDSLRVILEAHDVAKKARRRVLENFTIAAVYNAFAVPLAAAGLVTPLIAAIAMSGSSLIVTLNALRLAGHRKDKKSKGSEFSSLRSASATAAS
ncbi:MAG: heavy metal translocating P-type ATPase [Pseudomonadota bacterium]